jgi:Zn-dependent peptidase ImmA (M78 family)/transcriptional regulator with XRE-family HTH domain
VNVAGSRIRQAREFRGLTQTELARRCNVSQPLIAQCESEAKQPSTHLLESVALQTRFPIQFFRRAEYPDFPLGSLIFRARKAMTAKERDQVHRYGEVLYEGVAQLAERVDFGPVRIPRLRGEDAETPAQAAEITRAALGLSPDKPIANLAIALERAGVLILQLPLPAKHASAYSLWAGDQPVIVVFAAMSGDRMRMSVAHELGHLTMHEQLLGDEKQREREAFAFAGELLMPARSAREELLAPLTLSMLAPLKPRWGIALSALIMRAVQLDIITERQQRYLFQQLSQRGWRTREPANLDVPVEKPKAIRKMVELLYGNPADVRRLAADTGLPTDLLEQVLNDGASTQELPRVGPTPESDQVLDSEKARKQQFVDNVHHLDFRRNHRTVSSDTNPETTPGA